MPNTRQHSSGQRALDEIDRQLLARLRDDARESLVTLARRVHLAHATVHQRVKRLLREGYVRGFHARLDYARLDLGLCAYIGVHAQQSAAFRARLVENLRKIPEVEELSWVTGDFDALVKVRARNPEHLQQVVFQLIQAGEPNMRTRTMIVLSEPLWKPGPAFESVVLPASER
ncbi:MAG TPA: Lrp/AsnC family transcriptional regulator [Ktedonobacterales bacterium]|nr:Lrp/AsnC family transcriptional regulator [Ktedonobacterales bacterium]